MNPKPEDPERESFREWSREQEYRILSSGFGCVVCIVAAAMLIAAAAVLHFLF